MKESGAARIYSRALFLAVENQKTLSLEKAGEELKRAGRLIQSNQNLREFISHPFIPLEKKRSFLHKAMEETKVSFSPLIARFLDLLLEKKRIGLLTFILLYFEQSLDESNGILKAAIHSPARLDERSKREIERKLFSFFNKKIILEEFVQPELVAGVVIKAGNIIIDSSLKRQIKNLQLRFEHGN